MVTKETKETETKETKEIKEIKEIKETEPEMASTLNFNKAQMVTTNQAVQTEPCFHLLDSKYETETKETKEETKETALSTAIQTTEI
jgi:hypothetical protein